MSRRGHRDAALHTATVAAAQAWLTGTDTHRSAGWPCILRGQHRTISPGYIVVWKRIFLAPVVLLCNRQLPIPVCAIQYTEEETYHTSAKACMFEQRSETTTPASNQSLPEMSDALVT